MESEEQQVWKQIIKQEFFQNQLLKDVIKEWATNYRGIQWKALADALHEKGIIEEVSNGENFGKAMRFVGIEADSHTIGQQITSNNDLKDLEVNHTRKHGIYNTTKNNLQIVLPSTPTEYTPFNNNCQLTAPNDGFIFTSSNTEIAYVNNGRIIPCNDGTCIIVSYKKDKRFYYKVKVKDGEAYDDYKEEAIKERLLGRMFGYCVVSIRQRKPEYNYEKLMGESMETIINMFYSCTKPQEQDIVNKLQQAIDKIAESGEITDYSMNGNDFEVGVLEGKAIVNKNQDHNLLLKPEPIGEFKK